MTEQNNEVSSTPGLILRAAREELAYTIEHVADELHLRSSVVKALEEEDYDSFTSDVFLKGYFRSYCRLVNLHESRMVDLLDAQLSRRKQHQQSLNKEAKLAKQARRNKTLIPIAVVVAIAVSVLVFSQLSENADTIIPDSNMAGEPLSNEDSVAEKRVIKNKTPEVNEAKLDSETGSGKSEAKGRQDESIQPDELASTKLANINNSDERNDDGLSNEDAISESAAAKPTVEQNPLPVSETRDNLGGVEESNVDVVSFDGDFKAEFSGDCWFTLKDVTGKTVVAALKREGQRVDFRGKAPFRVVFGDARVANVQFNGEVVDLNPYTRRNGRAELTLGAE